MSTLTNKRIARIKRQANACFTAKTSIPDAKKNSKKEGIKTQVKSLFHGVDITKVNQIEEQFQQEMLSLYQDSASQAITDIFNLNNIDPTIYAATQAAELHCLFAKICFTFGSTTQTIASIKYTDSQLIINTKSSSNDVASLKENTTKESRKITQDDASSIIAHFHCFQFMQFGIVIPEDHKQCTICTKFMAWYAEHQVEALVFSGGGAKGVAYLGFLSGFGNKQLEHVEEVAGASIGAITAGLVAAGGQSQQIAKYFTENELQNKCTPYRLLCDKKSLQQEMIDELNQQLKTIALATLERINSQTKVASNDSTNSTTEDSQISQISTWKNKISDDGYKMTFGDLSGLAQEFNIQSTELTSGVYYFKALSINVAYIKEDGTKMCLDFNNTNSPDMSVAKAMIASGALPYIFPAVEICAIELTETYRQQMKINTIKSIKVFDGGLIFNLPMHAIESAKNVMMLSFDINQSKKGKELEPKSMGEKLIDRFMTKGINYSLNWKARELFLTNNTNIVYLHHGLSENTQEMISSLDFKRAAQQMIKITERTREQFIHWQLTAFKLQQLDTTGYKLYDLMQSQQKVIECAYHGSNAERIDKYPQLKPLVKRMLSTQNIEAYSSAQQNYNNAVKGNRLQEQYHADAKWLS